MRLVVTKSSWDYVAPARRTSTYNVAEHEGRLRSAITIWRASARRAPRTLSGLFKVVYSDEIMLFEREFGVTSLATRGGVWIAQEIEGTQVLLSRSIYTPGTYNMKET